MYYKLSDLDILKYLIRSLPIIELLFIVQIVLYAPNPWLSFILCISLPAMGPILMEAIKRFSIPNNNIIWVIGSVLLCFLCLISGPVAPSWLFAITGSIAATFLADRSATKITAVIVTIVSATVGSLMGGRSFLEVLPITTALTAFAVLFLRTYFFLARINQTVEEQNSIIQKEREEVDRLLLNILPESIIDRIKGGESPIADHCEMATVLFADIVDFTTWASEMSPLELVQNLDQIFSEFDQIAAYYNLEKIKTIGDAYMVVGGVPKFQSNAMESVVQMALDIQDCMQKFSFLPNPSRQLRIGIHAGQLVAGVIGDRKFAYDLWGDTVNTASRMESSGIPGNIHCTAIVYEMLQDKFSFEKRDPIDVKGKGKMQTYFIHARITEDTPIVTT